MAYNAIIMAPSAGNKLRRQGVGYLDQGVAYQFQLKTKPVVLERGVWGMFERLSLEVRHNAGIDLRAAVYIDNVQLLDDSGNPISLVLQLPSKGGWVRDIVEARFAAFGQKIYFLITSNTVPGQFYLDGGWVRADAQAKFTK